MDGEPGQRASFVNTEDGLAVVLRSQSEHLSSLRAQAQADLASARRISDRLDMLGADPLAQRTEPVDAKAREPSESRQRIGSGAGAPSLAILRDRAVAHLISLGIDPGSTSFEDLLDAEELSRIERRFDVDFAIHAHLDAYDVLAIAAAGLTASLLDILMVGIPQDTNWWGGGGSIPTSPITTRLRELSTDSDNALARWAKVSYDRVRDLADQVDGLGPLTHRVQTFGHDPLLGLVFGVRDIMRGTMTAIPRGGGVQVLDIGEGEGNPFKALALQLAHLLSDAPTRTGLPVPGWTALATLGGPAFGPPAIGGPPGQPLSPETIGGIARRMYLNGYDTWHFVSMSTSAAVVDIVLRGYWGLRAALDHDWADGVAIESDRHGSTGVSDHPRFASLSLGAHGVAATGNLVKLALAGGNPLALNYVQWLKFLRAFFRWADDR